MADPAFWNGRRVLLSGHTGFKGAWLALWLIEMGARVHGLSNARGQPSLHEMAGLGELIEAEHEVDVRDAPAVAAALAAAQPEIVIHMAAQAIVRRSLVEPAESFDVNVVGTANVLAGLPESARAAVVVTSDKCYRDVDSGRPQREDDPLGGKDPYSASKAAQELVAHSFRSTVLAGRGVAIATARAGNVIGGGDWAADRLVPDIMRAALAGRPVILRNPDAVRPWQHVLNPLSGYLALAERLMAGEAAGAWNFGPAPEDERPVRWVVDRIQERWPASFEVRVEADPHAEQEAAVLRLDSSRARERLGWSPRWDLTAGIDATVEWHSGHAAGGDAREMMREQLRRFAGP